MLDGPGPRFLQDQAELDGEAVPVGALLIDTPGANALRKNTDLFVKRGRIEVLSRAAAAIGLFTLNAYAPAGGAGIDLAARRRAVDHAAPAGTARAGPACAAMAPALGECVLG